VLSHIYYSILSVKVILTNRLFSRLGTLTNAKQNDKLEQTETAKKYKFRKNLHTNQIKTHTFCTLVKILKKNTVTFA